jgi:hypothetical protein
LGDFSLSFIPADFEPVLDGTVGSSIMIDIVAPNCKLTLRNIFFVVVFFEPGTSRLGYSLQRGIFKWL